LELAEFVGCPAAGLLPLSGSACGFGLDMIHSLARCSSRLGSSLFTNPSTTNPSTIPSFVGMIPSMRIMRTHHRNTF